MPWYVIPGILLGIILLMLKWFIKIIRDYKNFED